MQMKLIPHKAKCKVVKSCYSKPYQKNSSKAELDPTNGKLYLGLQNYQEMCRFTSNKKDWNKVVYKKRPKNSAERS